MQKVAILYIALGRYSVFWKDFYESAEKYLFPCVKHYFVYTDAEIEYADSPNVSVVATKKLGWPYDSLYRFQFFLEKEKELADYDYIFFFNANFLFYNPVDLAEITPAEWHDGLVAGLHPYARGNPDEFPYERRPESTAYIPYGKGKYYVSGAFNGGTSTAFLEMCRVLSKNIQTDLSNNIIACVDDESHLNAYMVMHGKKFLLCNRQYGLPEAHLKMIPKHHRVMIKLISRNKNSRKWGGKNWLRGKTDKRVADNIIIDVIDVICKSVSKIIPNKTLRRKMRTFLGNKNHTI